jgi:hypothetical protein
VKKKKKKNIDGMLLPRVTTQRQDLFPGFLCSSHGADRKKMLHLFVRWLVIQEDASTVEVT